MEPLNKNHIKPLEIAVLDGEFWKLWFANIPSPDQMKNYVIDVIKDMRKGNIVFAVKLNKSKKIVGTTRFYNVDESNKRTAIGYTWYTRSGCRTCVNSESKFLLLQYVFEEKKAIAVEFRTHLYNEASRGAIERLGAKQDGILRSHELMADGSVRDTAVYSIIREKWAIIKNNFLSKLSKNYSCQTLTLFNIFLYGYFY